jgi:hypothetical protein
MERMDSINTPRITISSDVDQNVETMWVMSSKKPSKVGETDSSSATMYLQ